MHCVRNVTEDTYWIGASDRRLALFENIFPIPRGVSYNSYVILDEKTVLLDTVDTAVSKQFFENLAYVLDGRNLDYLVINHMEPDHASMIEEVRLRYPDVTLVTTSKTVQIMKQFFGSANDDHVMLIKEGDVLSAGKHELHFVAAPMVHWPEVTVAYDACTKALFSADAFGTFGALGGYIFNDEIDFDRDWLDDARRYYTNIVGKYGVQVQNVLKKAAGLDIQMICPLHGPVWRNNLGYILDKYQKWSTYEPEEKGVVIAYASMYGNTANAADVLACRLAEAGVKNIRVYDVSNTHVSVLISEIFHYSHLVLAAPTYNSGIYPIMANLLEDMKALNVQNRTVGIMENGTWAATSGKQMRAKLEEMKNMTILDEKVTIKSALWEEPSGLVKRLAEDLC